MMYTTSEALSSLADALGYPDDHYIARLGRCRAAIADLSGKAHREFTDFVEIVRPLFRAEREELYIRTFDMNPVATLDLGWHLYAEDYNRGLFLAKLRGLLRKHEVPETHELPDHASHVLRLLARMPAEEAVDLAHACVLPALKKCLEGIRRGNPYRLLLQTVLDILETAFAELHEEAGNGICV